MHHCEVGRFDRIAYLLLRRRLGAKGTGGNQRSQDGEAEDPHLSRNIPAKWPRLNVQPLISGIAAVGAAVSAAQPSGLAGSPPRLDLAFRLPPMQSCLWGDFSLDLQLSLLMTVALQ